MKIIMRENVMEFQERKQHTSSVVGRVMVVVDAIHLSSWDMRLPLLSRIVEILEVEQQITTSRVTLKSGS
jgi:hypothetical protein